MLHVGVMVVSHIYISHIKQTVYSHESKGLYIAVHMKYSGYLFLS